MSKTYKKKYCLQKKKKNLKLKVYLKTEKTS